VAEKKQPAFATIDNFTADRFTATQWEPAEHKAEFARRFIRFVESDFDRRKFTDDLYRRLSMTFGHIAHHDRSGFYDTFFTTTEDKVRFLRQTAGHTCVGDPAYTYSDVERALQAWINQNGILQEYERAAQEQAPKLNAASPEHLAPEGAQIIAAASHRNGVSGAPFGVVLFEDHGEDGSRKIGIWFEPGAEGCHCAVLDVDKLAAGDIASMSNSWRGDLYDPMLRTVVEQIGREEQWRPVFGSDYWKQQQTPGPDLEPKAPQQVTPTREASRQTEQPVLTLVPESRYPTIAWLDLGRFGSRLVAAWNSQSESFTYTARLFCDDRPAFVPMRKHDLRSLQLLSDDRGLPWLREHLARRGFVAPSIEDLQQFQEIVRVNEALIGRFIEQGHKAVLRGQKLAEELDVEVLEIEPGQGDQPPTVDREGELGERRSKHGTQVSTLDGGHKGEQHIATHSIATMELGKLQGEVYRHQSERVEYYSLAVRRPFVGKDGTEKLAFDTREQDIPDHVAMLLESVKIMHQDRLERAQEKDQTQENRIRITRA
jgi:hypothetical protein